VAGATPPPSAWGRGVKTNTGAEPSHPFRGDGLAVTRVRGSLELLLVLLLVLVVTVMVVVHAPLSRAAIWRPLIHAYKAPIVLDGVRASLVDAEVSGMNVTAIVEIQPPNPCVNITARLVEGRNETVLLVRVEPPPRGTACIQVLPRPLRIEAGREMPRRLGYTWSLIILMMDPWGHVKQSRLLMAASARNSDPSIESIIRNPSRYEGRVLRITALYMGWTPPDNTRAPPVTAPPVSRSDWIIADSTAWIYVHGEEPRASWGEPVTITVVPRIKTVNGKETIYLERVG